MTSATVLAKRRALLDAIYAIYDGRGLIRVDGQLAQNLTTAWEEYDAAVLTQAAGAPGPEATRLEAR